MRRFLLTIGTAAALCGISMLYSALMRPVVPIAPPQPPPTLAVLEDNDATRPVENVRVAETYLAAQQPWTTTARYLLRGEQGAFLFTNDWQPDGKEGRIRLSPFAMAWVSINKDTGLEEAVTVVSESASLKFSGKFDMMSADAGRVIGATLEGRTQITGPNGLLIDGRNFHFFEASAKLWSDLPITFAYAGNKGSANRFQADLIPQAGPPERDRPHIFGVRAMRLSQNVKMDLQLKQKDGSLTLKMKCAGNFEYDIPQQTATFTDNVLAFRQTSKEREEFDWINCDKLAVLFGDPAAEAIASEPPMLAPGEGASYQRLNQTLKFRRLQAERLTPTATTTGTKTTQTFQLHSMENKLRASFRQLVYDGEQQVLVLTDPDGVKVVQAQTQLQSPEVMLQFGKANKLVGALCRGSGWINHREAKTNTVLFAADWKKHLRHVSDTESGLDLIELADTASFRQPTENSALGAELIRVWTTPLAGAGSLSLDTKSTSNDKRDTKPKSDIQLRRFEATQDVVLISPQLEGKCQHLEAAVDLMASPRSAQAGASPLKGLQKKSSSPDESTPAEKEDFPLVVGADRIRIRMIPTTTAQPDVAEVWTDGQVTLTQQRVAGKSPLSIKGDHVHVQHNGGNNQTVEIIGSMAQVRDNGVYLEAGRIELDRGENQMRVPGKGHLQLPVKNDFDGKELAEAQPLDVKWKERMTFDGRQATFHGQTRAELGESRIDCDRMEVVLSERISFTEMATGSSGKSDARTDLAAVHCFHDVKFHHNRRQDAKLVDILIAEVWEMHIDRVIGDTTAQGPGRIQLWQRGQGTRGQIAPQQSARANAPTQVDATEWEYTRVKFDGIMVGNLHRRHSSFKDRCEVVRGPVKHP
ncbi:MAG TPA: hypothetical protein VFG20_05000, partial [Planctomycetaceae bacterium]|nr:hypothetical protein [Planctomycetaceae bacterium]